MLELYTAGTHNGFRANIALAESGLRYQVHKVVLSAPLPERGADFLAATSQGRIPALVDPDGPGATPGKPVTLSQSGAIMMYVANKSGKLWPSSDAAKITALQWLMHTCSDVAPWNAVVNQMTMGMFPEKNDANAAFAKDKRLMRWLGEADARLGQASFLAGGEISLPDFALYPVVNQRKGFIEEAGMKNLMRWWAVLSNRTGVQKGMAESA
jgi:GSH-dependent disulfide-bond oxidoreductase